MDIPVYSFLGTSTPGAGAWRSSASTPGTGYGWRSNASTPGTVQIATESNNSNIAKLWVSRVIGYSSQYNSGGWSASQVVGPAKVFPRYGDIQGTWAQGSRSEDEYIEIEFPEDTFIQRLSVYETYHCGAVTKVQVWKPSSQSYVTIYEGEANNLNRSRVWEPEFEPLRFSSSRVRLELNCHGSWCEIDAIMVTGKRRDIPDPEPNSICRDLAALINNPLFSDSCFKVEGKEVYAHKAILVVRSEYFKAMFSHDTVEVNKPCIVLPDVKHNAFLAMMEFIYTGEISCGPAVTVDLLNLADMYGMEAVKVLCMHRIPELLTSDNVLDVFNTVGDAEHLADVRQMCCNFIASNYAEVTKSEAFHDLPKDAILEIVQLTAEKLKL